MTDEVQKNADTATLLSKLVALFKSADPEMVRDIEDQFEEAGGRHKNPGRGEVMTGPAEPMSGGGATKMIREYSTPVAQEGLSRLYDEFNNMMADVRKSLGRHETAIAAIAGVIGEAAKAAKPEATAPAADTFVGKAAMKLAKARAELRKAEMADEDDKEECEERKSRLETAKDLLKSAKRLLAKAEDEEDDEEMEKAVSEMRRLTKAVAKAEDEDKEREEAEKSRAAATADATAKAEAEKEAAAKAEEKEEDKKEEDAEKAKTPDMAAVKAELDEKLANLEKAAVNGQAILQSDIKSLIELVSGKSRHAGGAPEMAKSAVAAPSLEERVMEAIDSEELIVPADVMKARTLLAHHQLLEQGRMDKTAFAAEIASSSDAVRNIFRAAA